MHEELFKQLLALDKHQTAKRANCQLLTDPDRYIVTLLNKQYTVDLYQKQIYLTDVQNEPAGFIEQLCILAYLINAKDIPLTGRLVKAQSLPTGEFFFRGLHDLPTDKLAKAFGPKPDTLYKAAKHLDARKCEFGDASVLLYVLPRLPLTIVIWSSDGEFDARASILFDSTASKQMPLDALGAATNLTTDTLIKD